MTKYKFSVTEKIVIWKTHGSKCFWCEEPIDFKHITVDHVLPEKLLENSVELDRLIHYYSLPKDFQINNFCNWVPAHNSCNAKKSSKIILKSPAFLYYIDKIVKKSVEANKTYLNLKKKSLLENSVIKLLAAVENSIISNEDLLLSISNSKSIFYLDIPEITKNELSHIPEGWKIMSIDRDNGKMRVTNGEVAGDIPIEINPDQSWFCPRCYNYGPWSGNKCLICGQHNFPE